MSTKTAPPMPPPVGGAEAREEPGRVLAEPVGVDWLDEIAQLHRDAAVEWRKAVAYVVDQHAALDRERGSWRRACRDAVSAGEQPPPPPDGDGAVSRARLEVAQEDAVAARDDLARVTMTVLAALRQRIPELEAHAASLSPGLRESLRRGPNGSTAMAAQLLKQQMQAAGVGAEQIIDLTDGHADLDHDDQEMIATNAA